MTTHGGRVGDVAVRYVASAEVTGLIRTEVKAVTHDLMAVVTAGSAAYHVML